MQPDLLEIIEMMQLSWDVGSWVLRELAGSSLRFQASRQGVIQVAVQENCKTEPPYERLPSCVLSEDIW